MQEVKSGHPYPYGDLSNFSPNEFILDGVHIASMEGFLQALKYPDIDKQISVCELVGLRAKRAGEDGNDWKDGQALYWMGTSYDRESLEYQSLLTRAYETMFSTNEYARTALLDTGSVQLYHSVGSRNPRDTILTQQEFCGILMLIREQLKAEKGGMCFDD